MDRRARDMGDVDPHVLEEIEHFFEFYKTIEPGSATTTWGWEGALQAEKAIIAAKAAFQ